MNRQSIDRKFNERAIDEKFGKRNIVYTYDNDIRLNNLMIILVVNLLRGIRVNILCHIMVKLINVQYRTHT